MLFTRKYIIFILNSAANLTIFKLINFLRIELSYFLSILFKKYFFYGLPYSLSVEPTNICNLACPECPSGNGQLMRRRKNMKFDLFKKIIDNTYFHVIVLILYFQGEPFLNKEIIRMIKYAKKRKIFVETSTNGHFITYDMAEKIVMSGLDKLIISIDGMSQKTYEKYRVNGNLQTVFRSVDYILQAKRKFNSRKPFLILQFLVLKTNEHEIESFIKYCKSKQIDKYELKSAQLYDFRYGNEFLTDIKGYCRYEKDENGLYRPKNKLKNRCHRAWVSPVITVDGDLVPCCFDKNAKYSMGNIFSDNFSDIVKGEKFERFRKKILTDRKSIDICRNCL